MAANLTPQYRKAEEQYRRAATVEEELRWLEVMLKEIPKHKASEKLQADLKQKISRTKRDLENEQKVAKGTSIRIPRQGAGTVILLGGPNSGKSQLLASLTRATPEIAPYPFTTRSPIPGMMLWEDVTIQLIDTPPITADYMEPYMQSLIRSADLALLLADLSCEEGIEALQEVVARLQRTKTQLGNSTELDQHDVGVSNTRTLLILNKIDLPGADVTLQLLRETFNVDFPQFAVSALSQQGLKELQHGIYSSLELVRVYTKRPDARTADFNRPFTLKRGSTVGDVAELVHKDLAKSLKFARIWPAGSRDTLSVHADHLLQDKDIVELNT